MREYRFRIYDVPIGTLLGILEATGVHPHKDIAEIASFAGFSESTGRRALPVLMELGLVGRDSTGKYVCKAETVRRGLRLQDGHLILRRALQGYRPFEAMCEGLALGEDPTEAIRKARLLLGLDSSEGTKFQTLMKWGIELGVLRKTDGRTELSSDLAAAAAEEFPVLRAEDVESEAKARLFNARHLGREANNFLDEVDRQLLADALLLCKTKPSDSAEKSGQAVEDFLREIAQMRGHGPEAAKLSGAAQVANLLVSKGVIHTHHQKLVESVATARNVKAHRKDKKTLAPWEITEFGAFWALSGALICIRSIFEFTHSGRQII